MTASAVLLKDYRAPAFLIDQVELRFELGETGTRVSSRLQLRRQDSAIDALHLHGEQLELLGLTLDDKPLPAHRYQVTADTLTLFDPPAQFTLGVETLIHPELNTALEGLYKSSGNFCTQCEPEGFRKITYYLDRPDVMARFTTTVVAERERYPMLLSNGNPVERGELADGRHWVRWEDPFPKPSYLFALVAGDLGCVRDQFVTRSGRTVALEIYTEHDKVDQCAHAMASLKKAMRWDEERFGLEYDLDIYMIVAVSDFNMGAMENKGLNVFNTKFVLARPDTATDADFLGIESVIAHEYFHNWTGNRVTCRDWFQLSLKEGLTVFRDQEFSADMNSAAVARIDDVRNLRALQFPQDAGPLAHPVRPESYIEINNFYTVTVYEKGAEVVRMYQTLLGREGFRKGMDLYFQRHDGQAVTCEDFCAAMADANGRDLSQFMRWYRQAGTPTLKARGEYDAAQRRYTLHLAQSCPPTPEAADKEPFLIPVAVGLLDRDGSELPLRLSDETAATGARVLELTQAEQSFVFEDVPAAPVPSLLRGFSAPVKLVCDYSDEELLFLAAHDSDTFNRWEAAQQLGVRAVLQLLAVRAEGHAWSLPSTLAELFARLLADDSTDPALLEQMLTLPSEAYLAEQMAVIDVDGLFAAREFLRKGLALHHRAAFNALVERLAVHGAYSLDGEAIGRRALRNRCLDYLASLESALVHTMLSRQLESADNMTEQLAAITLIAHGEHPARLAALESFYTRWQREALVVDKWFTLQATSKRADTLKHVCTLLQHPAFNLRNPNKVRALVGAFCNNNAVRFHAADGSGYAFLVERIVELDPLNPQIAARLLGALTRWRQYDAGRQALMRGALERILDLRGLSPDVFEIASKALAG
ncbi:aminopeptidase N [Plasticicumulans acidivorans]|uniref:Aminopeptidase N n=1 Tax=Plasticicumulans acidivorans TaxID=886464 RepID=A0A317MXB7_9GAMM|nr:aminopeptidase N [Plasticicumulans acidivorans]PWV63449.1 aminopeptidase N [Plasticicumulans acidivorans]